jgi:cytoskeletal protein CcmA (bactofilin family)
MSDKLQLVDSSAMTLTKKGRQAKACRTLKGAFMSDNKSSKHQVIESGTQFEGVLHSEYPVLVGGQLKGEVVAPTLTLTNEGSVNGRVRVKQLKSLGSIGGEIDAESVELSGSVSDNTIIRAEALEVKLESEGNKQPVSFGSCELLIGDPAGRGKSNAAEQESVVSN